MTEDKLFTGIKTLPPDTKVEHKDYKGREGIVILDRHHLCKNGEVLVRFDGAKQLGKMRVSDLIVL